MFASLLPLSTDNISLLHPVAGRCVFWELEPSAAHHDQNQGFSALEKEAWLSRMLLEYGPCGFNISCGIDDTPALATVLFGDERNLPGVENMPTAPVTNGADVISSLFVETGFECLGFEQLLIDAALTQLTRQGSRVVEAFGLRAGAFIAEDESVGWGIGTPASVGLIPETILLEAGFTVVADHDVLPRLQMTLPPPQGLLAVEEAEELIRQALTAVQT